MFRALAGLALVLLLSAAHAQPAPSRLDEIVARGTLRVGMTGDYLPFTALDKETKIFRGFDVDMAQSLGKALGVKVEFVPTSWPQMMKIVHQIGPLQKECALRRLLIQKK
jgi:cyclohexadienyl dehydratase